MLFNRLLNSILFFTFLTYPLLPQTENSAKTYELKASVFDQVNNLIEGASVELHGTSYQQGSQRISRRNLSDEKGEVAFKFLPTGQYFIHAEHEGYYSKEIWFEITGLQDLIGQTPKVPILIPKEGKGNVTVRVVDIKTSETIPVSVDRISAIRVNEDSPTGVDNVYNDFKITSPGVFYFQGLQKGTYEFYIFPPNKRWIEGYTVYKDHLGYELNPTENLINTIEVDKHTSTTLDFLMTEKSILEVKMYKGNSWLEYADSEEYFMTLFNGISYKSWMIPVSDFKETGTIYPSHQVGNHFTYFKLVSGNYKLFVSNDEKIIIEQEISINRGSYIELELKYE